MNYVCFGTVKRGKTGLRLIQGIWQVDAPDYESFIYNSFNVDKDTKAINSDNIGSNLIKTAEIIQHGLDIKVVSESDYNKYKRMSNKNSCVFVDKILA